MATTPVTLADVYDCIVEWQNAANPNLTWRNTMTFYSPDTPTLASGIGAAIISFFSNFAHSDANFIKASIYHWARGRQPYPTGLPVTSQTYSIPGNANATSWPHLNATYTPNNGSVCLRMDHQPSDGGKPGRNFFRGLLGELDTQAVSGGPPTLTPSVTNLQSDLDGIIASSLLINYMPGSSPTHFPVVVRYSPSTGVVHSYTQVTAFRVISATLNKQTRKNKK